MLRRKLNKLLDPSLADDFSTSARNRDKVHLVTNMQLRIANLTQSKNACNSVKYRFPFILAILILALLPSDGIGIILCPFYMVTDLHCPVCGLTRSMSSLIHFEFIKSLSYHPLGSLVLVFLFKMAVTNRSDLQKWVFWKKHPQLNKLMDFKIIAILFLAVWFIRISIL